MIAALGIENQAPDNGLERWTGASLISRLQKTAGSN
jgi:hypothetical protein